MKKLLILLILPTIGFCQGVKHKNTFDSGAYLYNTSAYVRYPDTNIIVTHIFKTDTFKIKYVKFADSGSLKIEYGYSLVKRFQYDNGNYFDGSWNKIKTPLFATKYNWK